MNDQRVADRRPTRVGPGPSCMPPTAWCPAFHRAMDIHLQSAAYWTNMCSRRCSWSPGIPYHLDFLSYEATRSGLTCWFGFCSGVAW